MAEVIAEECSCGAKITVHGASAGLRVATWRQDHRHELPPHAETPKSNPVPTNSGGDRG